MYKFYPLESAIRNIKQRRLKISLIHELNDPFEFRPYRIETREDRTVWENLRNQLWRNKGIISFTSNWHHPLMWSHYADKHKGLALGLEIDDDKLNRVLYRTNRKRLPPLEDIYRSKNETYFAEAALIKHSHWRYEAESRTLLQLDATGAEKVEINGSTLDMHFEPMSDSISLREVIIGSECEISSKELRKTVGNEVKIVTARLAFQTFRVVEQENPKYHK